MLPHPSNCLECLKLHNLTVKRLRVLWNKIPVLSWCRICGMPVLLEVVQDYEYAKHYFHKLDDTPMAHKNLHAAPGGWGVHWRLDEVLNAAFGRSEQNWPTPPWYEHERSLNHEVQVMSTKDMADYAKMGVDVELRMLKEWINSKPRNREQLQLELSELMNNDTVFDAIEVSRNFEILAFKAPFAIAVNKETGERGSLLFQDTPRFYFGFDPHRVV